MRSIRIALALACSCRVYLGRKIGLEILGREGAAEESKEECQHSYH